MKKAILSLLLLTATAASANQHITVSVKNKMNTPRTDVPVIISLSQYGDIRSAMVEVNGTEIPCQLDDLDKDETFDELCFLADLDKKEKKQYTVTLFESGEPRPYPARVYAEMVMANTKDKKLKKHQQNNYIESITARGDAAYTYNLQHHHGIDFESELTGFRIYFDHRQSIDVIIIDYFKSTGDDMDAYQTYAAMGRCVDLVKNEIAGDIDLEEIRRIAIDEFGMQYADQDQIVVYSDTKGDTVHQVADID